MQTVKVQNIPVTSYRQNHVADDKNKHVKKMNLGPLCDSTLLKFKKINR
jgi:hypothetical protein